ncbi:MAG: hypothetical protein AAB388_03625 [Patescibacteria group bacterium]
MSFYLRKPAANLTKKQEIQLKVMPSPTDYPLELRRHYALSTTLLWHPTRMAMVSPVILERWPYKESANANVLDALMSGEFALPEFFSRLKIPHEVGGTRYLVFLGSQYVDEHGGRFARTMYWYRGTSSKWKSGLFQVGRYSRVGDVPDNFSFALI